MIYQIDVSIVILIWPGDPSAAVHAQAAATLATTLPDNFEIVIVENGVLSVDILWPRSVIRISVDRNIGVPGGWNIGLSAASGRIVCFINQDARTTVSAIASLGDLLDRNSDIFVVGPEGSIWDLERMEHLSGVLPADHQVADCDVVSGYLFAARRLELWAIGGFDLGLSPCGFEEVDLALRRQLFAAGRAVVIGGLDVKHEFGVSASPPWRRIRWSGGTISLGHLHERNKTYMITKSKAMERSRFVSVKYDASCVSQVSAGMRILRLSAITWLARCVHFLRGCRT